MYSSDAPPLILTTTQHGSACQPPACDEEQHAGVRAIKFGDAPAELARHELDDVLADDAPTRAVDEDEALAARLVQLVQQLVEAQAGVGRVGLGRGRVVVCAVGRRR